MYAGYICWFLTVYLAMQCRLLSRNTVVGIFYVFGLTEAFVCILQAGGAMASANRFFSVTGTFENPNVTAMYLAVCLPFGLFSLLKKRKKLAMASIALLLVAIVLLKCRTAFIGAFVVFAVYFWQTGVFRHCGLDPQSPVWRVRRFFVIAVLLLIVLLSGIFLYKFKKNSADGRLFIWKISAKMIVEKPLFGVGYGLFERDYNLAQAAYFQSGAGTATEKQNADHVNMAYNEYLEQAAEGGALGLLFYLALLGCALFAAAQQKDFEALSVVLLVVAAGFVNFVIQCIPLCILLFAYCATVRHCSESGNKKSFVPAQKGIAGQTRNDGLVVILFAVFSLAFFVNQSKLLYAQMQLKSAVTLAKSGKHPQALGILQKNENRAETSEAFMRIYGKLLLQNRKFDEAQRTLEHAAQYFSLPDIYFSLSECYTQKQDSAKAQKTLQTVANMIPKKTEKHKTKQVR